MCLGGVLISLLRHCDRVKIACLAQLVNVIAPIITVPGGMAYRQTIYYPFEAVSRFGRGTVLDIRIKSDLCDGGKYGAIPAVDSVSVLNGDGDTFVFAVNRDTEIRSACASLCRVLMHRLYPILHFMEKTGR